jgi:hypothetical protein
VAELVADDAAQARDLLHVVPGLDAHTPPARWLLHCVCQARISASAASRLKVW